jgi:ABC-type uncharacterized transport system ATPase subunit
VLWPQDLERALIDSRVAINAEGQPHTDSKVLLRAEELRREAGGKIIVREASFALAAGEVVAITGPCEP